MLEYVKYLPLLKQVRKEWTAEKYCWGAFARTATGQAVSPTDSRAVRWCFYGFTETLTSPQHAADAMEAVSHLTGTCVSYVSDHEGHAGAVAQLDQAIATLEAYVAAQE